jgi:tRNA dimethylallyltransferase
MDIGTAKPTIEQRRGVPHHGFDRVDPDERYSAGRFAREARQWIAEIWRRNRMPILVGGTGFFLRALTHPLFQEPDLSVAGRDRLDAILARKDTSDLERWARALDPAAGSMLAGGRQRLTRVIEVALLTGKPISWWHGSAPAVAPPLRALVFVLRLDRAQLSRRIDDRVHEMVRNGLVEEVRGLLEAGYSAEDPGMNATGYAELIPYFRGETSLEDALERTQAATRRYARRQMTWLRNQLPPGAVWLDAAAPIEELADTIVQRWQEVNP